MSLKIDFAIIGAQKSGTTTLHNCLASHQDIVLPKQKENSYFANDKLYEQGDSYLDGLYRNIRKEGLIGHDYVHLMYFTKSAQRLYENNPDMKLIAILRNPVERAYSGYWHARRYAFEKIQTFEEALIVEPSRINGTYTERAYLTYKEHGRYISQLKTFIELFGSENVKVILTDDLNCDTRTTVNDVVEWLGLSPLREIAELIPKSNEARLPRFPKVAEHVMVEQSILKDIYNNIVPRLWRQKIRETMIHPLMEVNMKMFRYPPMQNHVREALGDEFRECNEELAQWLGRDLRHWR